jgi:chemotaxis protein CheD
MDESYVQHLSPTTYFDKTFDLEAVKIKPGEYFVTQRDMLIVTVLGSCVSACIRDSKSGAGGMNHFMLPGADADEPLSPSARYGAYAMEILINNLIKLGAVRRNLEAKIFGGGKVLKGFQYTNIGERNVEFVKHYLDTEKIRVVGSDLLDIFPRKVYFFPKSGRALVRLLKTTHNNTVIERERSYEERLQKVHVEGDVELF